MTSKKEKFNNWNFLWAIIDTFVNIFVLVAVTVLLAERLSSWFLVFMILVFILWAFRPMYLVFKDFLEKFPKKNSNKKVSKNTAFFIYFLLYLFIFLSAILIFFYSVNFLEELVHPLVLAFSFMLSAIIIFLYHHFTKRKFEGPLRSFSKFFYLSTIILFLAVLFFSSYGLEKGINLEPQRLTLDVYIVNEALSINEANNALDYSQSIWKDYNISLNFNNLNNPKINLSDEEIAFLFNNGTGLEDCLTYTDIISRITDNSQNLSVIFLNNRGNKHAGRGCICNCSFALVSPEKWWVFDFTGWNVAHEIGHVLGLTDIQYYGRTRENLMNDETKKLLFIKSGFLDQNQIDRVINKTKTLNQENLYM
jgi:hypothetical protein